MTRRAPPKRKVARRRIPKQDDVSAAQQAVAGFEKAQEELRTFQEENVEFVDELRDLIDNYNATCGEATKALKAELSVSPERKLVYGQFGAQKMKKEWYDGHMLANLIPEEVSQLFLTKRIDYTVDQTKLQELLRQGEVEQEAVKKAFVQESPTLRMMPGCPKELKF